MHARAFPSVLKDSLAFGIESTQAQAVVGRSQCYAESPKMVLIKESL